jgi:hypothetical protein
MFRKLLTIAILALSTAQFGNVRAQVISYSTSLDSGDGYSSQIATVDASYRPQRLDPSGSSRTLNIPALKTSCDGDTRGGIGDVRCETPPAAASGDPTFGTRTNPLSVARCRFMLRGAFGAMGCNW